MNPLVAQILGGLVRVLLGGAMAWMIQRGIISQDQTELLIGGIVTALGTAGWIVWNKVKASRMLHTALAAAPSRGTASVTVNDIEKSVNAGVYAPALTSKDVAPVIQNNTGAGGSTTITGTGTGR